MIRLNFKKKKLLCALNFDGGQILLDQTKIERTDFGQKAFSDFMILNVACKFLGWLLAIFIVSLY